MPEHDNDSYLDELKLKYENAVESAVAARQIKSVDEPIFTDDEFRTRRVPTWEEVKPAQDEVKRIKELESPIALVSLHGILADTKQQVARSLFPPLEIKFHEEWMKGENIVRVGGRLRRRNKREFIGAGDQFFTGHSVDILFIDGSDEVPNETLGKSSDDFLDSADIDDYIALAFEGWRRGKLFDREKWCFLNALNDRIPHQIYAHGVDDAGFYSFQGIHKRVSFEIYNPLGIEAHPENFPPIGGLRRVARLRAKITA